jgi:hypothetical protein
VPYGALRRGLFRQVWQGSAGLESGEAGKVRHGAVRLGLVRQVRLGFAGLGLVRSSVVWYGR